MNTLTIRTEITYKQAMVRIMSGLPTIIEESRDSNKHIVFRYFIEE